MEELLIEEKAKRYDSMFERLKEMYNNNKTNVAARLICERYFPELKECEDKMMIQYFKDLAPFDKAEELYEKYGFSHKDAIAWLEKQGEHANFRNKIQVGDKVTRNEDGVLVNLSQLNRVAKKQGEQKPAWSERYIADVFEKVGLAKIAREQGYDALTEALQDAMIELSKFLPQPKQEWSEEDEYCRHQLIVFCENCMVKDEGAKKCANWLKSLRPQNKWKPSAFYLECISDAIAVYEERGINAIGLKEILEELKKLKG